jgi:hypothetical protein
MQMFDFHYLEANAVHCRSHYILHVAHYSQLFDACGATTGAGCASWGLVHDQLGTEDLRERPAVEIAQERAAADILRAFVREILPISDTRQ